MKTLLIVLAFIAGCSEPALETVGSANGNVKVELLTVVDGCKVYRIWDDRKVYLAKCGDNVVTSTRHSCGKNCTYDTSDMSINE